ncbi:MAG: hypothetical protein Q8Q39_04405 [bacterium]|nr:hypothetical protein [bacterium]
MHIFICCSKAFYGHVAEVKKKLEAIGHIVTPPNGNLDLVRSHCAFNVSRQPC